jgi:menaquinone-dependent protoporphyrinogen oxidase
MKRILVVCASKCGSTSEVAQAMVGELSAAGWEAETRPASSAGSPEEYDAVLLGSAVRFGQWLPEAVQYAARNQAALNAISVSLFTVHIMALDDSPESAAHREQYLAAVRQSVKPVRTAFFAGKIDPARLSLPERLIGRLVGSPEGDFRNWDAIRGWARQIV